ncbi:hypothetical protein J7F03_14275 [Streptomyces sp. ISL-43]|uniref:hypothetical protein n=1 Tax=Streptomyces sp. ISL-43 TaxID=2819183 RepID=UPI001BE6D165|nr:hypothetical protein [Streptomyces sp. ISL-43]MBT2448227.1 hypothetical protein [Streptomyces sp. ISL-43]
MNSVSRSRRTLVRAAAVAVCAGTLLAFPAAAALAEGIPAASSAQAAAPARTLVKTISLADGVSTAKVYRVAKGAYQADVLGPDGSKAATLASRDGATGFGDAGRLHLALQADGRLSSWVGEKTVGGGPSVGGAGYKTAGRDGVVVSASTSVREPVRAGDGPAEALRLRTLADGPGEGMLLLAAGGGIAAVGAAGLGFAMLRRGRTEA